MNKRQKKKAFKKKYGFNPTPAGIYNAEEEIRELVEKINDTIPILFDAVSETIKGVIETIPEVLDATVRIIRELKSEVKDDTSD